MDVWSYYITVTSEMTNYLVENLHDVGTAAAGSRRQAYFITTVGLLGLTAEILPL